MQAMALGQISYYLWRVCPAGLLFLLPILLSLFLLVWRSPLLFLLGVLWQGYTLRSPLSLSCDESFWLLCRSQAPNVGLSFLQNGSFGLMALSVREEIERRCLTWSLSWGPLAFSMLAGGEALADIEALYRNLGFLHVLVISGSQFTWLSRLMTMLLETPLRGLYALQILRARSFPSLQLLSDGLLALALLFYLLICGASPPCQRAFLERIHELGQRWFAQRRGKGRMAAVLSLQIILFPESWFTLSNALSWGAILCLRAFAVEASPLLAAFKASLGIQILNLFWFSRVNLGSLCLDLILSPFWNLLLASALLIGAWPQSPFEGLMLHGYTRFHELLSAIDLWQTSLFGSPARRLLPFVQPWGRLLPAFLFLFLILPKALRPGRSVLNSRAGDRILKG